MPHGNSLALAKECIYCIAKRICLKSTLALTTKKLLFERFAPEAPLKANTPSLLLSQKLANRDNSWASGITVKIKTAPSQREVRIPKSILEIDDLENDDSEGERAAQERSPAAQQTIYSRINRNLLSQEFVDKGIKDKIDPSQQVGDTIENFSKENA